MKSPVLILLLGAGVLAHGLSHAAAPANAPAGTTGLCNDGTWYSGASKKGACKGHKGVKEWYAEAATPAKAPPATAGAKAPQAAAGAPPAGSTGLCNDGTYYTGASKKGACKGHKGVKEWYGAPAAAAAPAKPAGSGAAPGSPPAGSVAPKPTTPAANNPPAPTATSSAPAQLAQAPGAAAGKVWVNKSTKVYHCPGDRWYGKTKEGEYMPEAQAAAQGFKPDHGKSCK